MVTAKTDEASVDIKFTFDLGKGRMDETDTETTGGSVPSLQ
jgi:hypothetical protein